jgi:hypothetical protein
MMLNHNVCINIYMVLLVLYKAPKNLETPPAYA